METLARLNDKGIFIGVKLSHGVTAARADGSPLTFALLDEQGQVVSQGDPLAAAILTASIEAQENFWKGQGHLEVLAPVN